jgi:hypothetical protein
MHAQFYAAALRADCRWFLNKAAVVTAKMFFRRVERQRDFTVVALFYVAAFVAFHDMRKTAPILEKNSSFFALKTFGNL